jgi:hypothetical protein
MKIFSPADSTVSTPENSIKKKVKGHKTGVISEKPDISNSKIREKLADHVETSNTAKAQLIQKNSKSLGAGFMNEEKSSLKDSHLLLSEAKLNDPSDSNTQEKLKMVLRSGGFNFNPKEKETLEKILGVS